MLSDQDLPGTITILDWREAGPPESRTGYLVGTCALGGAALRAEAIEVATNGYGIQGAVIADYEAFLEKCWDAFSMEGHASTLKIDDREYVVFIAPEG